MSDQPMFGPIGLQNEGRLRRLLNDATFVALCDRASELLELRLTTRQIAGRILRPVSAADYKCYWCRHDRRLWTSRQIGGGREAMMYERYIETPCQNQSKRVRMYDYRSILGQYSGRAPAFTVVSAARVTCPICLDWLREHGELSYRQQRGTEDANACH